MKKYFVFILLIVSAICQYGVAKESPIAYVVHGGAGTILKENMTPELEQAYVETLTLAVKTGYGLLNKGDSGEAAVIAAIQILEDSVLFNAGKGAVYTWDEEHELDASIMHGGTLNAGAVAGVKTIKSPIAAASAVMHQSSHVMLSGVGAEIFAKEQGLALVDNAIFNTPRRYETLLKAKKRMQSAGAFDAQQGTERYGTVGAVALDKQGNLVAGTSTGGMTAKRYGRVGDSPIIGAGTWADNDSCAVSATGHGEYFIRYHVAADICARMKYQEISLQDAASAVIHDVLKPAGGTGGIIAIDKHGNVLAPFNTPGMYRAKIDTTGKVSVGIYKNWQ